MAKEKYFTVQTSECAASSEVWMLSKLNPGKR